MNDRIDVIYGESYNAEIDCDNTEAEQAVFYVGVAGSTPIITKNVTLTEGAGDLELEPADTRIPLGEYNYMIKIVYANGSTRKFPRPDCDDDCQPIFEVHEALDETEVVS